MRGLKGVEIRRPAARSVCLCTGVALLFVMSGCGEQLTRMEENQIKLQAMVAANARELATLSSQIHTGAGKLEAGIQDLDADAQGIAAQVQTVQDDQHRLRETVVAGNQGLEAKATRLQEGQQSLHNRVAQVQDVADQTASDLSTLSQRHTALHETVQTNQRELNGRMGAVLSNQEGIQAGMMELHQADEGLSRDIASVTGKQVALSAQVQDDHKQVAERLTALAAGQDHLSNNLVGVRNALHSRTQAITNTLNILEHNQQNHQAGIDRLFATTNQTAATIATIAAAQTAMQESLNDKASDLAAGISEVCSEQMAARETSKTNQDAIITAMAGLSDGQQTLRSGINQVNTKTDTVTNELQAAARRQDAMQQSLTAGNEALGSRMTTLAENQRSLRNEVNTLTATAGQTALAVLTMNNGQASFQQAMQTGMNSLHERASQTAADVHGMAEQQTIFQESIKTSNETLVARTVAIEENQQTLNAEVGRTARVIDRAYADLTGVSIAQDTLQTTFAKHSDQINDRMARIEGGQKSLGDSQDVLMAMTGQTVIDVLALTNGHTDLRRSIKAGNEAVIGQTAALAEKQKTLSDQLDILTATTGQTAVDVLALENGQATMAQRVQAGLTDLSQRAGVVADNQQQMQGSVDVLTATTGQTALDVMNVAGRQDNLQKAIQSYSDSINGQVAAIAENQQKVRSGLDAVKATTGQTAHDVVVLSEVQARSEQTAQAGRAEVAAKLETIAQDQQIWLQRFDTAQARIQAMADGIAALDQQLGKLQGALQVGIQNSTTLMDTNGRQRQQFEAKLTQDVQAVIDAISQLRRTQAQLQEQMSQVQKTTQNQTETLKATLEQIKQPPAEVKVSDAAHRSEPVTVQTGE